MEEAMSDIGVGLVVYDMSINSVVGEPDDIFIDYDIAKAHRRKYINMSGMEGFDDAKEVVICKLVPLK
jgi:hypothetical protein